MIDKNIFVSRKEDVYFESVKDNLFFEDEMKEYYTNFYEKKTVPDLLGKTVKVTEKQFGNVYKIIKNICTTIGQFQHIRSAGRNRNEEVADSVSEFPYTCAIQYSQRRRRALLPGSEWDRVLHRRYDRRTRTLYVCFIYNCFVRTEIRCFGMKHIMPLSNRSTQALG